MVTSFTCDRQVLELTKNEDHFMLIYPKTPNRSRGSKRSCAGLASRLRA